MIRTRNLTFASGKTSHRVWSDESALDRPKLAGAGRTGGPRFIAPDGGGPDVFVHIHDVEVADMKTLVADQLVAYEVGPARDGRTKAVNLLCRDARGRDGGLC